MKLRKVTMESTSVRCEYITEDNRSIFVDKISMDLNDLIGSKVLMKVMLRDKVIKLGVGDVILSGHGADITTNCTECLFQSSSCMLVDCSQGEVVHEIKSFISVSLFTLLYIRRLVHSSDYIIVIMRPLGGEGGE